MAGTVFIVEQNTEGEGLNCPRLAGRTMSGGAREEEGRRSRFSNRFTGCNNGSWGGKRGGDMQREEGKGQRVREGNGDMYHATKKVIQRALKGHF